MGKVGEFVREEVGTVRIKSLTMALTVISSVSLVLSLISAKELVNVFSSSFTFFSANALAFYGTREGRDKYLLVIKVCFGALIADFCLLLVAETFKYSDIFCLWIERIVFIPVAVIIVLATIRINANSEIKLDKKIAD